MIWTKTETKQNFLQHICTDLCSIPTFNMTKMVIFSSTVYFFQPLTTLIFFSIFSLITNIEFLSHLCRSLSLSIIHTLSTGGHNWSTLQNIRSVLSVYLTFCVQEFLCLFFLFNSLYRFSTSCN